MSKYLEKALWEKRLSYCVPRFIKIMLAGGMNYSRRYTCKHSRKLNI